MHCINVREGYFNLVSSPELTYPLTRRNGLVNQVEFLWIMCAFVTLHVIQHCSNCNNYRSCKLIGLHQF